MVEVPRNSYRAATQAPAMTASEITFSDGTKISLNSDDVVIFVGPNNSGKSAALKIIQESLALDRHWNVIKDCKILFQGTNSEFIEHLQNISQVTRKYGRQYYSGYDYEISVDRVPDFESGRHEDLKAFFSIRCPTDRRLTGSEGAKAIAYRHEQPNHPIHILVMDRDLEGLVSDKFHNAFGKYLYVNRAGGSLAELFVSDVSPDNKPADDFSAEGVRFFESEAQSLTSQGDGMRAFATLALNTYALSQQSIVLIDEPEAFLHPPQAKLIGEMICREAPFARQIFVATHSSDVLKGILVNPSRNTHILRISRKNDINTVRQLDPETIDEITKDPLIRFSGIFDGIFYRHVIICEADTDCQFYSAILDAQADEIKPDALFVQSAGKHRMAKLGRVARDLGVPFSIVVDIDCLNDKRLFQDLCEACGIEWSSVSNEWRDIFDGIGQQKVPLTVAQLVTSIEEAVVALKNREITALEFLSDVRERVRSNSPWEQVKRGGRSALPLGSVVQKFDSLTAACAESGLWIVPEGELEGFCRTVRSKKGSSWIIEVSETLNWSAAPELSEARTFVDRIWKRATTLN